MRFAPRGEELFQVVIERNLDVAVESRSAGYATEAGGLPEYGFLYADLVVCQGIGQSGEAGFYAKEIEVLVRSDSVDVDLRPVTGRLDVDGANDKAGVYAHILDLLFQEGWVKEVPLSAQQVMDITDNTDSIYSLKHHFTSLLSPLY